MAIEKKDLRPGYPQGKGTRAVLGIAILRLVVLEARVVLEAVRGGMVNE
jgi:hypothetical protein